MGIEIGLILTLGVGITGSTFIWFICRDLIKSGHATTNLPSVFLIKKGDKE